MVNEFLFKRRKSYSALLNHFWNKSIIKSYTTNQWHVKEKVEWHDFLFVVFINGLPELIGITILQTSFQFDFVSFVEIFMPV